MAISTSPTTARTSMAIDGWGKIGGVVMMAGAPAVFWAYTAKFVFGLFGVGLSVGTLALIVMAIFLFLGCIVSGLALRAN